MAVTSRGQTGNILWLVSELFESCCDTRKKAEWPSGPRRQGKASFTDHKVLPPSILIYVSRRGFKSRFRHIFFFCIFFLSLHTTTATTIASQVLNKCLYYTTTGWLSLFIAVIFFFSFEIIYSSIYIYICTTL